MKNNDFRKEMKRRINMNNELREEITQIFDLLEMIKNSNGIAREYSSRLSKSEQEIMCDDLKEVKDLLQAALAIMPDTEWND